PDRGTFLSVSAIRGIVHSLTAGFFIMFISNFLDSLGVQLGFWYYQYAVVPFIPASMPWNTSLLPVFVMFLLQYKNISSPYIKAIIFATISAFVGEPFAVWIKLYNPVNWKYLYSFPIYIILYLISHYYSRISFQKNIE
ncbi:CBO0543 family protein, partial [Mesobacillus sp. MER 33]|uniref:CBO0543 family protein n=1 Tax=Mesobacillus sp. MER 33 TaxID=2939594 RepID=UPI002559EBE5